MLTCDQLTLFELGSGRKDKITLEKDLSEHEASDILLKYWDHLSGGKEKF